MHIEVDYCGKTYVGVECEGDFILSVKAFTEDFSKSQSFKLELENGEILVLGSIAIQTGVFRLVH